MRKDLEKKGYKVVQYEEVSKKTLDEVEKGDLIYFNDWRRNHKVREVSENFIISTMNMFGKCYYSICHKNVAGFDRNEISEHLPYMGTDNVIGTMYDYSVDEEVKEAIDKLEEDIEKSGFGISPRRGVAVRYFAFKKSKK